MIYMVNTVYIKMEEVNRTHSNVIEENERRVNSPEISLDNNNKGIRISEFELLKNDLLSRIEFLEKEINVVRRKPVMIDFDCQTELACYYGDNKHQVDVSTQTCSDNTENISYNVLDIKSRLDEIKFWFNDRVNKLQDSLRCNESNSVDYDYNHGDSNHGDNGINNNVNIIVTSQPMKYTNDTCKVKFTPYSMPKPYSDSFKFRCNEDSDGKTTDIRASLENSKQLFQQEIEASLYHGRMQHQAAVSKERYSNRGEPKSSAFTQYVPVPSHVINSKGVCNVYNPTFYDGRRSVYHDKHSFHIVRDSVQISREEFARELIDEIFAYDELAHANVTGVKGKRLLDPKKIQIIKDSVLSRYPLQGSESEDTVWKLICDKINTKCRGVTRTLMKRKANNSTNGFQSDYYPMRKKGSENEYLFDMPPSMANPMYPNTSIVSPVGHWSNNEKPADKSRDIAGDSDTSVSVPNICSYESKRESSLSVSYTSVSTINRETTSIYADKTTTNYTSDRLSKERLSNESSEDPPEDINSTQCHDNDSNSNSLTHSEDTNPASLTQYDDNSSTNNDHDVSKEDILEAEYTVDESNNINRPDVKFETGSVNRLNEGYPQYPFYKPNLKATSYQNITTQFSETPPADSIHTSMGNNHILGTECRNYCRQECSRGSRKELTRNLIDSMFSRSTLAHSNVTGARGKSMLEPSKIAKVREMVFTQYPAKNKEEEEVIWRKLTTKINTKCRGVKRFLKRKNLLSSDITKHELNELDDSVEKTMLRNALGLDRNGESTLMLDRNGETKYGLDRNGESTLVLDRNGETKYGVDRNGENTLILDRNGEPKYGLDRNGESTLVLDRNGETKYGLDRNGENTLILDRNGETKYGLDRNVESTLVLDRNGENKYGSDRSGENNLMLDRNGESKFGSDHNGESNFGTDRKNSDNYASEKLGDNQYVSMVGKSYNM